MTADYNKFNLEINDEYKLLPANEYVYNHKGDQLFFYAYNPADVPVYQWTKFLDLTALHQSRRPYAIQWDPFGHANYNMPGADCQGTPTFSHWTADDIADRVKLLDDVDKFEPLTVQIVHHWFGWILYRLENAKLTFRNPPRQKPPTNL